MDELGRTSSTGPSGSISSGNSSSSATSSRSTSSRAGTRRGEGIWDWEFVDGNFLVHVDVAFKPDEGVVYDLGKWQTQIAGNWNQFSLATEPGGRKYPINCSMRKDQSRAERSVHKYPTPSRGSTWIRTAPTPTSGT